MYDWKKLIDEQKEVTEKIIKNFEQVSEILGETIKPHIKFYSELADPENNRYEMEPVFEVDRIFTNGEKAANIGLLMEIYLPVRSDNPLDVLYRISQLLDIAIHNI